MSRGKPTPLETAAIECATVYAVINGYEGTDKTAVGLFLAGMAIVASCRVDVVGEFLSGYLEQLPDAEVPMKGWADYLAAAVDR